MATRYTATTHQSYSVSSLDEAYTSPKVTTAFRLWSSMTRAERTALLELINGEYHHKADSRTELGSRR